MDYKHLISFFLQKLKKDNIGAYAAQAALFIIMSAIPFLLVFLSLLRFTPVSESTVLSVIQMILPGQIKITPMLINVVNEVYTNSTKMLPIAVIFAVYSAAKSIQSLRYGLNIVYPKLVCTAFPGNDRDIDPRACHHFTDGISGIWPENPEYARTVCTNSVHSNGYHFKTAAADPVFCIDRILYVYL